MQGIKFDTGKDRWDLLPLGLVTHIVKVFTFGAQKYAPNSWQNLPDGYNRYKAALFRHIVKHEDGEIYDNESGLPHLAHAAWNALVLLHFGQTMGTPRSNALQLRNTRRTEGYLQLSLLRKRMGKKMRLRK
jgi:hypothetical protein